MAGIELQLGAHRYRVPCAEAEQERLEEVAGFVEEGAAALADSGAAAPTPDGEDPDRRFLALLSLLLADQLYEAHLALQAAEQRLEATDAAEGERAEAAALAPEADASAPDAPAVSEEIADALSELLDSAASRMERLAERFEKA